MYKIVIEITKKSPDEIFAKFLSGSSLKEFNKHYYIGITLAFTTCASHFLLPNLLFASIGVFSIYKASLSVSNLSCKRQYADLQQLPFLFIFGIHTILPPKWYLHRLKCISLDYFCIKTERNIKIYCFFVFFIFFLLKNDYYIAIRIFWDFFNIK